MKRTGIAAALFAAMLATPAMACTDWKAIAAFDALTLDDRIAVAQERSPDVAPE